MTLLSYVDDPITKVLCADAEWFYEKLFKHFDCKEVQWPTKDKPLNHLRMTILMTDLGVYISMQDYICTILVKLNMEGCANVCMQMPMHKPITNFTAVDDKEKVFFMSACSIDGCLAMMVRPNLKHCHSCISQHMSAPNVGVLNAMQHAVWYCATHSTACLFQLFRSCGEWKHYSNSDQSLNTKPQNKCCSQLSGVLMCGSAAVDWSSTAASIQISEVINRYE